MPAAFGLLHACLHGVAARLPAAFGFLNVSIPGSPGAWPPGSSSLNMPNCWRPMTQCQVDAAHGQQNEQERPRAARTATLGDWLWIRFEARPWVHFCSA